MINKRTIESYIKGYKTLTALMPWRDLNEYVKDGIGFELIEFKPETLKQNVLILASHPSSEVFGCGGTLALHAQHGDSVQVIYLTDGSRGTPSRRRDKALINLRQQEAEAGLHVLGGADSQFWKFPDGRLEVNKTTSGLLKGLFEKTQPDVVYIPWYIDDNPDCTVVTPLILEVISGMKSLPKVEIRMYEVWHPLVPNRIAPIGEVIEQKIRAMEAHRSQLASRARRDGILGLNAYRGAYAQLGEPAEAYFVLPLERFHHFYQTVLKIKD